MLGIHLAQDFFSVASAGSYTSTGITRIFYVISNMLSHSRKQTRTVKWMLTECFHDCLQLLQATTERKMRTLPFLHMKMQISRNIMQKLLLLCYLPISKKHNAFHPKLAAFCWTCLITQVSGKNSRGVGSIKLLTLLDKTHSMIGKDMEKRALMSAGDLIRFTMLNPRRESKISIGRW